MIAGQMPISPKCHTGSQITSLDFKRWFPHVFWVSAWTGESSDPDAHYFKILSARDECEGVIEVTVLRTHRTGNELEIKRFTVPASRAHGATQFWVDTISKSYGIRFEQQDYSSVRSLDAFNAAIQESGWEVASNECSKADP